MTAVTCAACGQAIDSEAIRRGVCPACGADAMALPAHSRPGAAWLVSRLLFVVVVLIFAAVLRNLFLLGFAGFVVAVLCLQFWWKRSRLKPIAPLPTTPEEKAPEPHAPLGGP